MTIRKCTEEIFLNCVSKHEMIVFHNDDVSRRIRFQQPGSTNCYFDLITWPGHLCYTGDMGTYVFARTNDMFEFFRTKPQNHDDIKLHINTGYWAEKCLAESKFGNGIEAYSHERFVETIKDWVRITLYEIRHVDRGIKQSFITEVKDRLLNDEFQFELEARDAVDQFRFKYHGIKDIYYYDFWEIDLTEYTYHYIWCCYAIAWGIKQYDLSLKNVEGIQ